MALAGPTFLRFRIQSLIVMLWLGAFSGISFAEAPPPPRSAPKPPSPFRGSLVALHSALSARSFDKNADLTYDPTFTMALHLAPAYSFGPHVQVILDGVIAREFTRSDTTSKRGEIELSDFYLQAGLPRLPVVPVLKLKAVPFLRLIAPSSKTSKARTLILGIRTGVALSRRFKVFNGLTLRYAFHVQKNLHESTTLASEAPLVTPAPGSIRSIDSFRNLGERNVSAVIANQFAVALAFKKVFTAMLGMGISHGFLYRLRADDDRISNAPMKDTRVRYIMYYTGELAYRPIRGLELALGFETENNQLAQNATYEAPFFNRYTAVFLDVRFDVPRFTSGFSSRGKK